MHYSHGLSSKRISQIAGLFVVIPLLGLIVVGIFMAKAEQIFEKKYHLRTSLSQSYGLEPGAPVLMSGVPIGRVEAVEFNERGTIDVLLETDWIKMRGRRRAPGRPVTYGTTEAFLAHQQSGDTCKIT